MSDDSDSFISVHYIICECGETFNTDDCLKTHLEEKHPFKRERKEYKCGICGEVYPSEEICIYHYETTHVDDSQYVESTYEIDDEKDGIEATYIVTSNSVELEKIKKKRQKRSKNKQTSFPCEECGRVLTSSAALFYHKRVHTGERPEICSVCHKAFARPLFLQIHMRIHTGERPYRCSLCPKAFTNQTALLRHNRVHTGEKPYMCNICGKSFTQSNSMKLHIKTVHMKQPAPYKSKNRQRKALERQKMNNQPPPVDTHSESLTAIESITLEYFDKNESNSS